MAFQIWTMTAGMRDFINSLPKAELHLHLEGTIEPSTLVELSKRVDPEPLTLTEAQAIYHYDDFAGFLEAFSTVSTRLTGPEEYALVTRRMIEQLAAQGVVHAEVYFSVGELFRAKQSTPDTDESLFTETMDAIEKARIEGEEEHGVSIYWITDSTRHEGVCEAVRVFHLAAKFREKYPSIVGIGLGGDERIHASEPFRALFAQAAEVGLRLTNHAGENTPATFIWEALSVGSERLGHVCSAINDPALLNELRTRQIPLELNPTSNIRLGNCKSFQEHPLRKLFDLGLLVTLNSDDPGFFGSNVENEYYLAHTELQFTRDELKRLAVNSFNASFLPSDVKMKWINIIQNM